MANKNYDLSDIIVDLATRRIVIDQEKKRIAIPADVHPGIRVWGFLDFLRNRVGYIWTISDQTYAALNRSKATDRKPRKERRKS
jgi:hypothetical protein